MRIAVQFERAKPASGVPRRHSTLQSRTVPAKPEHGPFHGPNALCAFVVLIIIAKAPIKSTIPPYCGGNT